MSDSDSDEISALMQRGEQLYIQQNIGLVRYRTNKGTHQAT